MYNAFVLLPLLWVCLGFLAGIVLAAHLQLSLSVWLALGFVTLVLSVLQPRLWPASSQQPAPSGGPSEAAVQRPAVSRLLVLFIALLGLCLGAARYQLTVHRTSVTQIDWFNDRQYDLLVTGTLVDPPDYRDTYTNLRLQVQSVDTGLRRFEVGGLLLARVAPNRPYQYGQNLRLRGRLETPPANEDFSYRDYLARQNVYSTMPAAVATILPGSSADPLLAGVYSLKAKLLDRLQRIFLDPEASLLAGILLGVDTRLPPPVQQAFKDTGTAHIIAISGFNIAIIAGIFILLFSRLLRPRLGAVVAVAGIIAYTVLVGPEPSVVRAALMGMLSLFAVQVGRRQVGVNTLAFVAALMGAWNPQVLWDVGFQLSFFATLGLILYGAPLQSATERFLGRYFPASNAARLSGLLAEFVLLTLAAQLTTLPIMAYHFKQISLISFIANPFVLPAQPAVMILGGVALAGGILSFPLGRLLGLAAWPLTAYTVRMVEFFDGLPHGLLYLGSSSLAFVVCFYAVLLGATFGASQIKAFYNSVRQRFRFLTISLVLTALFIGTLLVWRVEAARPDGKLHVTFISAGSADAVLVQTPGGRSLLIDGGPSPSALADALGRRLSPLDPSLDWLVMASTDEQQVSALPRILPGYPPRSAMVAGNGGASFSSRAVMEWLDAHSIPVTRAETDQIIDLGDGALLRVVDVSPRGASLLILWNDFHMLLPIGANLDTLDSLQMGTSIGPVDVLSLAESGYAPLAPPDWIHNLNPRLVVIDVAPGDPDGRPDQEALDTLGSRSVLRTDVNGWIDVSTDGQQMWINAQREPGG